MSKRKDDAVLRILRSVVQMWGILAVLLGGLAFVLIFIACVPDHQATRTAEKRREATVVARAADIAMRNIQATNTAKANVEICLAQPSRCRSLGLDWVQTARECRESGRSVYDCNAYVPTPNVSPRRVQPSRVTPAHMGDCYTAAGVRRPCVVPPQLPQVPRPPRPTPPTPTGASPGR